MKKLLSIAMLLGLACMTSCVEDNPYQGPPSVSNISFTPAAPVFTEAVTVTATLTGIPAVTGGKIQYKIGSGTYTAVTMTAGANNVYSGTIPAQADGSVVSFHIEATNAHSTIASTPDNTYTVGAPAPNYSNLILNEIDGNAKCIELYNNGPVPISLNGVTLIKNNGGTAWWEGSAASGSIAAGGYVLIYQTGQKPGGDVAGFVGASGISPKQNLKFELKVTISGNSTSLGIFLRGDEGSLGATISDTAPNSYQRCPNGTGDWKLATPTTGAANPATGTAIPQS